jgi:HK97 family phage portal protein
MGFDAAFLEMFAPKQRASSTMDSGFGGFGSFYNLFSPGQKAINYKTSLKLSAFFNGVDQISNDIAKIPFSIYKKDGQNRVSANEHPAAKIISGEPNELMTSFVFRKTMAVSLICRGNALAKINTNKAGFPESADLIDWDCVQDIRIKNGQLLYFVHGYKDPLFASEVLHFKNLSHNGITGVGVVTYAAQQLNLAIEVQTFSATNFENKGVRQGVIETDKVIEKGKDKIIAAFKTGMQEKSPDRVVVLDEGMKFKAINITPQELQIIEQQRFSIEDIARWLNIAPHKIKSLQQSTNNNIEQQSLDHVSDTIHPYVTNIEQEYAKKLLNPTDKQLGYYVRGNLDSLLRADIKSRGEYLSKMVYSGIFSRNEARRKEDMNDGPILLDEYLTPTNQFTEKQIENNLNTSE